jgi:hypothetical protein
VDVSVSGEIPSLLPLGQRPTVGLIVSVTGQWSWISKSLGLAVSWIWMEDEDKLPEWLRIELPDVVMTSNRYILTQVNLILCEHRAPPWLSDWALTSLVVATEPQRSPMPCKWHTRLRMTHQDLGGLTTVTVGLSAYSSIERKWDEPAAEGSLLTSVGSMASDTVEEGKTVKAPGLLFGPPTVKRLGRNLYHGGGLYPAKVKRGSRPYFILTSVHAPTWWVKRRLTTVEEWTVKDVPVRIVTLAQNAGEDMFYLWKCLKPGRCLEKGLRRLCAGIQVVDGDGRVSGRRLTYGRVEEDTPVEGSLKRKVDSIMEDLNELSLKKEVEEIKTMLQRGPRLG